MYKTKLKNIKPGHLVKVQYNISSIKTVEIECVVTDTEEDRLYLTFPDEEDKKQYFSEGKSIFVTIITDHGIKEYQSMVIYSPLEGKFVIEYYEENTKITQRREFLRVNYEFDIIFPKGKNFIQAKTINLSGGGIRFFSNDKFLMGEIVDFSLILNDELASVKGVGEIIYSDYLGIGDVNIYAIKFNKINENDRNRIIKMCFKINQKNIKESND